MSSKKQTLSWKQCRTLSILRLASYRKTRVINAGLLITHHQYWPLGLLDVHVIRRQGFRPNRPL